MADKDPKDMTASELLRWLADDNDQSNCQACSRFYASDECGGKMCSDWKRDLADKIDAELAQARKSGFDDFKLADWYYSADANGWPKPRDDESLHEYVDRCFLPRPRFEDGEPVQFGDEPLYLETIDEIDFYQDGTVTIGHDGNTFEVDPGEGVERPAPEVLGADGLPIKVGDAMWSLSGAGPLTVTSLHTDDPTPDGGDSPWADLNDDGLYSWIYAGSLTHTPPDTQQDIDEDATMPPAEYCAVRGIDLGDDPDRATATEAMVRDLLRRQRELDKRTGGDA